MMISVVLGCTFVLPFSARGAELMPGEVASVNGQGVSFSELESRRSRLFDALSPEKSFMPDEAALREQYSYILRVIIDELIICQYMVKNKLDLADGAVEREEASIRGDYTEGGFEQMLQEEGVNPELWRESLRRNLLLRKFQTEVLRPEISISPDEVNAYYKAHANDFVIPEQWHFMRISGVDKKEVELARDGFLQTRNATAVQQSRMVSIHDIRTAIDRLPEGVARELARLTAWKASPVKTFDEEFCAFVLLEKFPATQLGTEEIYRRVEQAIGEEKLQSVHARWMEKQLEKAVVRIAPVLLPGAPLPGAAKGQEKNSDTPKPRTGNATGADTGVRTPETGNATRSVNK